MVNDFGQLELGFDVEIENYENTAKKNEKEEFYFKKVIMKNKTKLES